MVDYSGRKLIAGKNDVLFVYATIVDKSGTTNLMKALDEVEEQMEIQSFYQRAKKHIAANQPEKEN